MMQPPGSTGADEEFSFQSNQDGDRLLVRFFGTADMKAATGVAESLKHVHSEAVRLGVREAWCDFGALQFMNSACFKSFVHWVTAIEALEPSARYTLRMRGNPALHWQKRSLDALRCLSPVVAIEL